MQTRTTIVAAALLLAAGAATAGPAGLDPAYDWHEYNGHWYALTSAYAGWSAVEAEAVAAGGDLVTISDALENDWLGSNFPAHSWIGLYQVGNYWDPNGWAWISGESSGFRNWDAAYGQPDGYPAMEAAIFGDSTPGKWHDVPLDWAPFAGIIEVPEPGALSLLTLGGLAALRRRRLK